MMKNRSCLKCGGAVEDEREHQLRDGWECDSLLSPMEICPNCSMSVGYANDHQNLTGSYACPKPASVSYGEQRILNALGNENAVGTVFFELDRLRKLCVDIQMRLVALETGTLSVSILKELAQIQRVLKKHTEERDAAVAEVEFLRIKVEELETRKGAREVDRARLLSECGVPTEGSNPSPSAKVL